MVSYRYLLTDLLTNKVIGELPLTGVTYTQALNDGGDFNGSLQLSDPRISELLGTVSIAEVTTPAKTGIWVERNGIIEWGGIIWSRQYDSQSQTMSLAGREFESYLTHRHIMNTFVFDQGTDQFTVVKTLVDDANSAPYGNIGIDTSSIGTCGQGIADVYAIMGYEARELSSTIVELSKQGPPYGFDYHIEVGYDSSYNLYKRMVLFYPRKGVTYSTNLFAPMLEFPGSLLNYSYPEDGGSVVNSLTAFGPGSNDSQYVVNVTSGTSFARGYPLLEDTASYSQIPDPRVVDNLAKADVEARSQPVVVMEASWVSAYDPLTDISLGPSVDEFNLGDQFRIRITDDRFPDTLDTVLRLSRYSVAVGDNGEPEMVSGSFIPITY